MNAAIQPYTWSNFPLECFWYFVLAGVVHLAIFTAGTFVIATFKWKQPDVLIRRIRRFGLFVALLLLAGSLFNGLWSCLVWGRIYYSTDYVFDFTPIWPITQSVIDMPFGDQRGQLLGVTLSELQLVWLSFAAGTWTSAVFAYRFVLRIPPTSHWKKSGQLLHS